MKPRPLSGNRWRFVREDLGAARESIVAEVTAELDQAGAEAVAHVIADRIRARVLIIPPGRREPQSRRNPTLVHHGLIRTAMWHLMADPGGDAVPLPLAELYSLHHKDAVRVAVAIATIIGRRVILMDNRERPPALADHPILEFTPRRGALRRNPKRKGRNPGYRLTWQRYQPGGFRAATGIGDYYVTTQRDAGGRGRALGYTVQLNTYATNAKGYHWTDLGAKSSMREAKAVAQGDWDDRVAASNPSRGRSPRFKRGSIESVLAAARKIATPGAVRYVYPTAHGLVIELAPPPFGLQHYRVFGPAVTDVRFVEAEGEKRRRKSNPLRQSEYKEGFADAQAYQDGYKSGRGDALLGQRSDLNWSSVDDPNPYVRHHARGYRDGWTATVKDRRPNPRAPLQVGETVTVPYFGRSKRRSSERATVLGLTPEGVHVEVRKGKSTETRIVPEHQVRRARRRGGRVATERIAALKSRLEVKSLRQRHTEAVAAADKARSDFECAEAQAKQAQPYQGETASPAYRRLLARMRRAHNELEAQSSIAAELERADPAYVDQFATNRRPPNPKRPKTVSRRTRNVTVRMARVVRDVGQGKQYLNQVGGDERWESQPGSAMPLELATIMARGQAGARVEFAGTQRANPGNEVARARRTFRKWHEFDSHKVTRMKGPDRVIPRTLVKLGDVPEIIYRSSKWEGKPVTYSHKTRRPYPVLATDPDGRHLFLVGGNVKVTADGLVH